jgi:hypothetical protein
MTMRRLLLPLILVTLLSGCAGARAIVPSQSTLAEVRAKAGNPTDVRFDANGDELWEYAGGPRGTETYLIRAGKDGRVKSVTQLLTEEQFNRIEVGKMMKADVRHLLGRPSDEAFLYNGTSWSWRAQLVADRVQLIVHFDPNGVVLNKIVIVENGKDGEQRGEDTK